jgi:hypothetical protein
MNKAERQLKFEEDQVNKALELLRTVTGSLDKEAIAHEDPLLSDSLAALTASIRVFSEQPLKRGKAAMAHHVAYLKAIGYEPDARPG